ncbi:MAG: hypothetical protein HY517_04335 [Candidatus Aenigmarchaeota archaeon]|nr:hypothetical protein [Candidatus Aenigmarchaeota archaeon]
MKIVWESIAQEIVPSLRAMIAKELIASYNLNQTEAARLMGVSQPAVSQYLRRLRGKNDALFSDKEIVEEAKKLAAILHDRKLGREELSNEFAALCKFAAGRAAPMKIREPNPPSRL